MKYSQLRSIILPVCFALFLCAGLAYINKGVLAQGLVPGATNTPAVGGTGSTNDSPPSPTLGNTKPEFVTPTPSRTPTSTRTPTPSRGPTATRTPTPTPRAQILYLNSMATNTSQLVYEQQVVAGQTQNARLSAAALLHMAKGRGLQIALVCAANVCPGGKGLNETYTPILTFDKASNFYKDKNVTINIPGEGTYKVLVSAFDGTEAEVDNVQLIAEGPNGLMNLLENSAFEFLISPTPALLRNQPVGWGAGLDDWGFEYAGVNTNYNGRSVLSFNSSSRVQRDEDGGPLWARYEFSFTGSGQHTIEVDSWTPILKDRGARILIACGELDGCPGGKRVNDVYDPPLILSENTTFESKNQTVILPPETGTYFLRIFVNDGSEGMFDTVTVKNADGAIVNPANNTFDTVTPTTYSPDEPRNWPAQLGSPGYYQGRIGNDRTGDAGYCRLHPYGDANCDDLINDLDYAIWKDEYIGRVNGLRADFNRDDRVSGRDFEIWRNSRFDNPPETPGNRTVIEMIESNITI